jgi:hypothetical protein
MTILECCELAAPGHGRVPPVSLRAATLLPSAEAPEMVIFQTDDRRWRISDALGVRPLQDGAEVRLAGRTWRLREAAMPLLCFKVSQDEEHVVLQLLHGGTCLNLGERSHHQTLLLLARERRADECSGRPTAECGWRHMADLVTMLGLDAQHLNIHVFRARRQIELALQGFAVTAELVQRRAGQIRFGALAFEVTSPRPEAAGQG